MHKTPASFKELFQKLTTDYGIKDYTPQYLLLLEEPATDQDDAATEEHFMKRTMKGADSRSENLKESAEQVSQLIREAFRVFGLIAPVNKTGLEEQAQPTVQRALHDFMFKILYHIGLNCRNLAESTLDQDKHNYIDEYATYLKEKHQLAESDFHALALKWVQQDEIICQSIMKDSLRIMIFGGENVCFQVRNKKRLPVLKVDTILCTENGLIISKFYFLARLVSAMRHLELMTHITALEKGRAFNDSDVEIMEIFEMGAFYSAATEFFAKHPQE